MLVLTSPRQRARETCALAGLADRAEVTDDLTEWNYGELRGAHDATRSGARSPTGRSSRTVHRAARPPTRSRGARRPVDRGVVAAGGTVALFSHGHFLRVLGARWIGLPASAGAGFGLDTATVSCLGYEREQRVLRVWNA